MKSQNSNLPLFEDETQKQIKPSGSVWEIDPNNPATIAVPLQTVIVEVDGPYTEKDRKLWTFLLHAAWDKLDENGVYSERIEDINQVFRGLGGDRNTKWIWASARRLAKTTVEWNADLGDGRFEAGISSMFAARLSPEAKQSGVLHYHFPKFLVPILKQPERFARLRTHFLISLSGKYTVTLYEVLEGYANLNKKKIRVSIDELRIWLKVPEKSYKTWKDLKRWVLDPSLKKINASPEGSGFTTTYEVAKKSGKYYTHIDFIITKTEQRKKLEAGYKKANNRKKKDAQENRPNLKSDTLEKAKKATNYTLDIYVIETEFWEHWEKTGRPKFDKGVDAAFIGFAKNKAKQA